MIKLKITTSDVPKIKFSVHTGEITSRLHLILLKIINNKNKIKDYSIRRTKIKFAMHTGEMTSRLNIILLKN